MSDETKSYFGYTMRDINAIERQIEKLTETNEQLKAIENAQKVEITMLKERIETAKAENRTFADEKNALQAENNKLKQEVETAVKKLTRKTILADLDK